MLTVPFGYYLDCDGASRKKGCVHSRSKADLLGATADVEKQRWTSSSAASRSMVRPVAEAKVGPPPGVAAGRLSVLMLDARRVAVAGLPGCGRDGPVIAPLQ